MNKALRVGLTGGIGSGKTTVSNLFGAIGVPVIDADKIAREVVEPGRPAYNQILSLFGEDIIDDNGQLKREHLREIIFKNRKLKRDLESIIHPYVNQEMKKCISEVDYPYCIISIPLLLETGITDLIDRVLVVDVEEELQLQRTLERNNIERDQALAIMKSQAGRNKRLNRADDIIDNNGDIESLNEQVHALHRKYLQLPPVNQTQERSDS